MIRLMMAMLTMMINNVGYNGSGGYGGPIDDDDDT